MLSSSLKRLRENAGLTQQQVADILNIDRSTYAYYEIGKTSPGINSLKKLSRLFNVSYSVLIDGTGVHTISDNTAQYNTTSSLSNERFYSLSADEKKLIMLFRLCSNDRQSEILKKLEQENNT